MDTNYGRGLARTIKNAQEQLELAQIRKDNLDPYKNSLEKKKKKLEAHVAEHEQRSQEHRRHNPTLPNRQLPVEQWQIDQLTSPRRARMENTASTKTTSISTRRPVIMSEAAPAMKQVHTYFLEDRYLPTERARNQ